LEEGGGKMSANVASGDSFGDEIELLCVRFEAELRSGGKPQIEAYVEQAPEGARPELIRELLKLDIHYRRERGETILPGDYTSRFPEHASLIEMLLSDRSLGDPASLPAADPHDSEAVCPSTVPLPLSPGTVFAGRYKIREKLPGGGMGDVYVADQAEPVQRRVVIKVIKPELASYRLLARFEQERQALAVMDHPNIAKVLDAGIETHGRPSGGISTPYFVMELIKGVPITKYCDEAKLTPKQRLDLFIPVCQAVQHAHQKGIIHRDLKPSNILVGLYDGRPVPKVIDFGVAKVTGWKLTDQSIYTELGAIIGTFEYMSPEQAELDNLDIDTRSDIYALGVVLYELLTGTVPFSRKELKVAGIAEMLRIIKEVEPQKPSTRLSGSDSLPSIAASRQMEPKKLALLLRNDLDWIVMKALEKDRSRRYDTANAFAMDVQNYLTDEPVLAGPPSAGYRLRKFIKRKKGQVMAGALVFLALVVGTTAASLGMVEARKQRDDADTARADADHALDDANKANASLLTSQSELRTTLYDARMNLLTVAWEGRNYDRARALLDLTKPTGQLDDPAGFEWHYWKRRSSESLHAVKYRKVPERWYPIGLHYSQDSSRYALFHDRQVPVKESGYRIIDSMTNKVIRQFDEPVEGMVLAPKFIRKFHIGHDGRRLLVAGGDCKKLSGIEAGPKRVQVWDVDHGNCLSKIEKKWPGITILCRLSPDNRRALVVVGEDEQPLDMTLGVDICARVTVRIIDLAGTQEVFERALGSGTVRDVQFSGDCAQLLVTRAKLPEKVDSVEIWDAATGKTLIDLAGNFVPTHVIAVLSQDGALVATSRRLESSPSELKLWDARTGQEVRSLKGHAADLRFLAFNPKGNLLAACDSDGHGIVWDVPTGEVRQKLPPEFGIGASLPFGFGANDLLYSKMSVWDGGHDDRLVRIKLPEGSTWGTSLACSPVGDRFAATWAKKFHAPGTEAGFHLQVWDATGKELLHVCKLGWTEIAPNEQMNSRLDQVFFSPQGDKVAVRGKQYITEPQKQRLTTSWVRVWDLKTGLELKGLKDVVEWPNLATVAPGITDAWFTPDGTSLTAIRPREVRSEPGEPRSGDTLLTSWDATTGQRTLDIERKGILHIYGAHTPDGKEIWLDGFYIGFRRLVARTGEELEPASIEAELTADNQPTGKIRPPGPLRRGERSGAGFVFDSNGTHIIVPFLRPGAGLARLQPPEPIRRIKPEAGSVWAGAAAISPDGRRAAMGGGLNQLGVVTAQIAIFNVATQQQATRIIDFPGYVEALTFTPDSQRLACLTVLDNQRVLVFRVLDGRPNSDQGEEGLANGQKSP
jgi:serine/threonine protein kinase/WD40 repeat protein